MATKCSRSFGVVTVLGGLSLTLAAQSAGVTTGDVHGKVLGEGNRPRPGVRVLLVNQATGDLRETRSDLGGAFWFRGVAPGTYGLRVGEQGSAPRGPVLEVRMGSTLHRDLPLSPMDSGAVVAVEDSIDPARTQQAVVIDRGLIQDLPINRRSFSDFSLTTPWAATNNTPVNGGSPSSGLSFLGMSARQNNFLVDGLDNNDLGGGALRASLSQDAVQAFQVVSGTASAEFGRALGGIINTVTRSGTNTPTGSAFLFHRGGGLAADQPDLSLQQAGATVGGPLVKDRLFYFVAMERLRKTDDNRVSIDPQALGLIQAAGFSLENGNQGFEETDASYFLRLDWLQSAQSRWSLRIMGDRQKDENQIPWGGLVARSAGGVRETTDRSFALNHQWVGDRWLNEARLLVARRENSLSSLDPQGSVFVDLLGTASFGTQRLTNQRSTVDYLHLVNSLTVPLGDHTLKAGLDLLRSDNEAVVPQNFAGIYRFQALPTVGIPSALAAFATPNPFGGTGIPVAFVQSFGTPTNRFTARSEAAFLQDDWQVAPTFLLKAGLRFEREVLPTFDDTADYEAIQHPGGVADPVLGPVQLTSGTYDYAANFKVGRDWGGQRISPRLAFSWQVLLDLRLYGGAGRYSGPLNLGPLYGARLFNGRDVQTVIRTILDNPFQGPLISWANADGQAADHRYASIPAGPRTFVIPGGLAFPFADQQSLGLEWAPNPRHRLVLDLLRGHAQGLLNVRDVNAFQPYLNPATGQVVLRRPDLRYSTLNRIDGSGEARTESQSLAWTWRPSAALLVNAAYTHSRVRDNTIDWTSDFTSQNTFAPGSDWGPGYQQQSHRFVTSGVWSSGPRSNPWCRDWTLAWIAKWASGRPFSKLAGYDRNFDGDGTSDRPEGVGRTSETTPATKTIDVRVAKAFSFNAARLEFTVDVFNLANWGNILQVQNDLSSTTPAYGTPTVFGPRRQVQVGARYAF